MESAVYSMTRSLAGDKGGTFATTHWSAVLAAGESGSPGAAAALEQLCRTYWYPLYAYVRRQGNGPEEARDLTQAFFARLIEKAYLPTASPERGKFRTFLLTSLKHFLVNEWKKMSARKRGGGAVPVSLQDQQTENRYLAEDVQAESPEQLYEKRYALALLEQVLGKLQAEFVRGGKGAQFDKLKILLWGDNRERRYAQLALELGLSEGALKVAVHRLKQRYRELLRAEVARTVVAPSTVDEELRHLIAVISG